MKIILLYEMNHEIEGLFHDVHLGGLRVRGSKCSWSANLYLYQGADSRRRLARIQGGHCWRPSCRGAGAPMAGALAPVAGAAHHLVQA